MLAGHLAVAVENARLYAEIQKNEHRLGRELRIAQEIQHALFPEGSPSGSGWEASGRAPRGRHGRRGRQGRAKGDLIVLYTDGVIEARRGREEYGPERLLADLEGYPGDESPADDVTLVVVKVL